MSLNWEFKDKTRFAAIKGESLNDAFIWGTIFVGIGEITEKNVEEWFFRYRFYDELCGPFNHVTVNGKPEPYQITLEDTRKRIGLKTNVFPKTTDAQFAKKVWKYFVDDQRKEQKAKEATK
jgi:hypothetical protein